METIFKIAFFTGVLVFCLVIIGLFLLSIKIGFLFSPEIQFMGIKFTPLGY